MRSIQKVIIQRAEGLIGHPTMRRETFTGDLSEGEGNRWLRWIAETAPATGGYDKTDVWVTLSNGQEYQFRFDVQHTSLPDNDTDIRQHVKQWFTYIATPEQIPYIAADPRRLAYARKEFTDEERESAASLLALMACDYDFSASGPTYETKVPA